MSKKDLIIIGASGHGKVVAEIAERINCYENIYFIDDYFIDANFQNYKILGDSTKMSEFKDNADFFVAIGDNEIRKGKYQYLIRKSYQISTLIDPNAVISKSAEIGQGTVVMPGTIINASTKIGMGCIINTKVSIDHDCQLNDFVHISPGATLAGNVSIEQNCWVGTGANIINNVKISENTIIGAGALIIKDIYMKGTYVGVPGRRK